MRKALYFAVSLVAFSGLWTDPTTAQESRMLELVAPRALGRGESVEIQITTGPLAPGARLVVMTEQGEVLGQVTPFGVPGVGSGNTATVPVPRGAMVDGRLRLRLLLFERGAPPRAPRPD